MKVSHQGIYPERVSTTGGFECGVEVRRLVSRMGHLPRGATSEFDYFSGGGWSSQSGVQCWILECWSLILHTDGCGERGFWSDHGAVIT